MPDNRKITMKQAKRRALQALDSACRKSDYYDNGGFASHEVNSCIRAEIERLFA